MNQPTNDDLFWMAAQYAVGDLPDDATAEFERLLETDQTAREALAQAVGLAEAVAQAEAALPLEAPTGDVYVAGSHRSTTAWVMVAAAACVALAFVLTSLLPQGGEPRVAAPVAEAHAAREAQRQLALAWVEGQWIETQWVEGQTDADVAPANASPVDPLLVDAADEVEFELPELDVTPAAPDWLLAALADAEPSTSGEN